MLGRFPLDEQLAALKELLSRNEVLLEVPEPGGIVEAARLVSDRGLRVPDRLERGHRPEPGNRDQGLPPWLTVTGVDVGADFAVAITVQAESHPNDRTRPMRANSPPTITGEVSGGAEPVSAGIG